MKPIVLSDVLAVGEFPTTEQIAILAKAGFRSVLNNQPDGEVVRFRTDAAIAAEAARNGMSHAYAPLSSRTPPPAEMACYADAVSKLPSPIYAFCYSGARSAAACAFLLSADCEVDLILRQFDEAGFDISGLRPWLDDEHRRRAPAHPGPEPSPDGPTDSGLQSRLVGASESRETAAFDGAPDAGRLPGRVAATAPGIVIQPRVASFGGFAI